MDNAFYLLIECPNCNEEFHHGLIVSTHEHNGRMAVPIDLMEQTEVECEHCDATIYFGELDYEVEGAA